MKFFMPTYFFIHLKFKINLLNYQEPYNRNNCSIFIQHARQQKIYKMSAIVPIIKSNIVLRDSLTSILKITLTLQTKIIFHKI